MTRPRPVGRGALRQEGPLVGTDQGSGTVVRQSL